jgi:hypothetical protein
MQTVEEMVPGLAAMREVERRNRALVFAGITHTVCGEEIRPLTPRSRLELQILRNAFTLSGLEPLAGDIFEFLWVHHPKRPAPGKGKIAALWRQNGLRRRLRARKLEDNRRAIREYLVVQLQDMPEERLDSSGKDQSPWVHWVAFDASFWINKHGGFTLETYLDTPMLVLQQLYRAYAVNHPEALTGSDGKVSFIEPEFINASDRVRSEWLNTQRESVSQFLRAQRYRLP